jgi:hypothetical protein
MISPFSKSPPIQWPTGGELQAAQRYKQELEDVAKQANKRIVEAGWKNE